MTAVEQVHAVWSAFASGGPAAALDVVDEACEWVPSPDLADVGPLRNGAAAREHLERLDQDGVRIEATLQSCEEVAEDAVLAAGRMRIVSPTALSDAPHFWLYRMRAGRIARVETYASRQAALAALPAR